MDGKELKQRLEQAKRDDKDLALEKAHKEIERLAKLLNEAEKPKPKLRHGDYGTYKNSGNPWWVWKRNGVLELFGRSCGIKGKESVIIQANTKGYISRNHWASLRLKYLKMENIIILVTEKLKSNVLNYMTKRH